MGSFALILIFFAGLVVVFGLGSLIGHLFKIDKYVTGKK